jgi:hypothetical protein
MKEKGISDARMQSLRTINELQRESARAECDIRNLDENDDAYSYLLTMKLKGIHRRLGLMRDKMLLVD